MPGLDLAGTVFRKSSRSEGGGCVEAAVVGSRFVIRDSKDPGGGSLVLGVAAWNALLVRVKRGAFDI